jgi:DNA topoisomerase III
MINRILCVAEKPSISKSVALILSGGHYETKSTKNKYVKNYEFDAMYEGRSCRIVMTAMLGHLMEMEIDPSYKRWSTQTTSLIFDAEIKKEVKPVMLYSIRIW